MVTTRKKQNPSHKVRNTVFTLIVICLVVCIGLGGLKYYRDHHKTAHLTSNAQTTSKLPTAQNNYSGGANRTTSSASLAQGDATDSDGDATGSATGSSSSSSSGLITLDAPSSGQTIGNGAILSGTASVSQIQFRVIDNSAGVIAQGPLNVVNGKFSGTLNFHSYSSSGQLDVFSYNSAGAEVNEIAIPIKFKGN